MSNNCRSFLPLFILFPALFISFLTHTSAQSKGPASLRKAPGLNKGTVNNLVICVGFSDKNNFINSANELEEILNGVSATSKSVKNYYKTVSYNQLIVNSNIYPKQTAGSAVVVYKDIHTRNFYRSIAVAPDSGWASYENGGYERLEGLIKRAFAEASAEIPATLNLDADNDGNIDNVAIIISGKGETFNDVLYPICGSSKENQYVNGKKFGIYNILFEEDLTVGVMCHEFFHTIGAPDLYHYKEAYRYLKPVDRWDLMGEEGNQNMTAYMKWKYGQWISKIPEITTSGDYTLKPLGGKDSTNICYKISSGKSSKEYFMIEYRRQEDLFESYIPASGLLIYRISTATDGNGNRNYPDSPDELYVMRPGGSPTSGGTIENATFASDFGRTTFGDKTNPADLFSDGSKGGISITNIGALGETISFHIELNLNPPTAAITGVFPDPAIAGRPVTMKAKAIDPDEDSVMIQVKWGDGYLTNFEKMVASGEEVTFTHVFTSAGKFDIQDEAEDEHEWEGEWSAPYSLQVTESPDSREIRGKVVYANSANTPLVNVKVILKNSTGIIDSAFTDNNGEYKFSGKTADTYTLSVFSPSGWGGVNSTDALLIRRYLSAITSFDALQLKAADVNKSGGVNSTDALMIRRRLASIDTSFSAGNWVFENPTIVVTDSNATMDMRGLCTGDVNGSYVPVFAKQQKQEGESKNSIINSRKLNLKKDK